MKRIGDIAEVRGVRRAWHFRQGLRRTPLGVAGAMAAALLTGAGCAEIRMADDESASQLADRRTELEEETFLVEYQRKRKEEAIAAGQNPDDFDDVNRLKAEDRYKAIWKKQRTPQFEKFFGRYKKLSFDIVKQCSAVADRDGASIGDVDRCTSAVPEANYDPARAAGVAVGALLLALIGLFAYRQTRRVIDPVAQAAPKLQLTAAQERRKTVLTGSYKGHKVRIESAAPEADGGDKYIRVQILDGIRSGLVVRFGPLAPPTGLDLPDLDAPEVSDSRVPEGYKLRLSPGASAEELLGGDIGFQIREFDPVDIRVHDGVMTTTTWFIASSPDQVVELVDLTMAVAETYAA